MSSKPNKMTHASAQRLDERHVAELRGSGLSDEMIRAAGLYSATGDAVTALLNWQSCKNPVETGLVFPYRTAEGSDRDYARLKLDQPRCDDHGKAIKYESPRGRQNHAYFPPRFAELLTASHRMLITEGEKKSLAAAQAGFGCVGLVGVWGFQRKRLRDDRGKAYGARQLIPDLADLGWRGREVIIVFDSDVADRPDLQLAEYRLAELLTQQGASVRVARLPKIGEGKTGLDDFLVHHAMEGSVQLLKVIESAVAPELPKLNSPMDYAKLLVDECFVGRSGLRLRYWREDFWQYRGSRYQLLSEKELEPRVLRWLDEKGFNALPRTAHEIVKCLASLCLVPFSMDMPCWVDAPDHGTGWVSFENGLYRIGNPSSIQSLPHSAGYFSPWTLDYAFEPKAKCPTWINFLDDVLEGDIERIDLLQRWFGLLLTPDTSFQKLLLFVGPPRAGKGTTVRVMTKLVGPANCASPTLTSLANRFGLAGLLSKTVAVVPDAHLGRHADSVRITEVLKSVVGEDPQDIDRKYRTPLTAVRLQTRFVISCNELAHFSDPSGALAVRVSALPFFKSYAGQEDRSLETRLTAELPGIANWARAGLARLHSEGCLNVPSTSKSIHDSFMRLTNPSAAFIEDCLRLDPNESELTANVYSAWVGWCAAHGHKTGSEARLGERLRATHASITRNKPRQSDGSRPYRYQGLCLTPEGLEHGVEGRRIQSLAKSE